MARDISLDARTGSFLEGGAVECALVGGGDDEGDDVFEARGEVDDEDDVTGSQRETVKWVENAINCTAKANADARYTNKSAGEFGMILCNTRRVFFPIF